jgi:hypothetical protein
MAAEEPEGDWQALWPESWLDQYVEKNTQAIAQHCRGPRGGSERYCSRGDSGSSEVTLSQRATRKEPLLCSLVDARVLVTTHKTFNRSALSRLGAAHEYFWIATHQY